jgi:hypothetical protein
MQILSPRPNYHNKILLTQKVKKKIDFKRHGIKLW